jgi:hypothetical protein
MKEGGNANFILKARAVLRKRSTVILSKSKEDSMNNITICQYNERKCRK